MISQLQHSEDALKVYEKSFLARFGSDLGRKFKAAEKAPLFLCLRRRSCTYYLLLKFLSPSSVLHLPDLHFKPLG